MKAHEELPAMARGEPDVVIFFLRNAYLVACRKENVTTSEKAYGQIRLS